MASPCCSAWTQDAGTAWLPAIATRPVLPFERFHFRTELPHALAAVRASLARGEPIASNAAMPARDGSRHAVGSLLRVEAVEEAPGGGLDVHAVGLRAVRVLGEEVRFGRHAGSEAQMYNVLHVEWSPEPEAETADLAPLRSRVLRLLGQTPLSPEPLASACSASPRPRASPVSAVLPAANAALAEVADAEFSWRAAARLPLPAAARGTILHVTSTVKRLEVCAAVLTAAARSEQVEDDVASSSAQGVADDSARGSCFPRARL
eukprot:TRINITY_DN75826_c0_g1_i1.p1 TRINITY_DN75826_c0_g1~~TRINITY_DN75826_c0_g1_i1.p1  ORF type:complete len:278 (+),score=53.19 TRINITY_DN75826_c0_g1_i1:46-834(+)